MRPGLLALAVRLSRDAQEAEEALQDTLERAWARRGQLRSPEAAGAWLRRILARTVVDRARARPPAQPMSEDTLEALLPDVSDPLALITAAEDELQLRAALRRIPEPERLALVLHDAEGWPAAEIAALLGSSAGAVHKRIQRGRAHLLAALADRTPIAPAESSCRLARRAVAAGGLAFHTDSPDLADHLAHCPHCPATLQAAIGVIGALGRERIEQIGADQRVRLTALTEPDPRTA
jgi:RNA polymerase sigma-70 factor (ECF subfamily)